LRNKLKARAIILYFKMLGKTGEINWTSSAINVLNQPFSKSFYRKGLENVQSRMLARVACHDLILLDNGGP